MTSAEQLQIETEQAFEWLAEGIPSCSPITFVPNPGNIGDAAINLACWRFLCTKFENVTIGAISNLPATDIVFIGGGGNLVEPLYPNLSSFLQALAPGQRIFIFPSTIYGYGDLLDRVGDRTRVICREDTSYRFVREHLPAANIRLGHDAAFAMARGLRAGYDDKIKRRPAPEAKLFRTDRERAIVEEGGLDIMGQYYSDWLDLEFAEKVTRIAEKYILGFGRIHTDRLHCAIFSALLDRETILYPNSYFKNAAVFSHSLRRLQNVKFAQVQSLLCNPQTDPVAFLHIQVGRQ